MLPGFPSHHRTRASLTALWLCLAAACTDRTATSPELRPPPGAPGAAAALVCRADVRAGTMQCSAPVGAGGGSATILGGQGVNVRLHSTGMSYDDSSTFRMDVTVENLIGQALGTWDGVTPSSDGVRVFFSSGPTSATGTVEVANATGEAFFTAAGQTYFQYDGILLPGDTTAPKEWRFSVPPSVTSFQFGVYVAARVASESGWLRMEPFFPSLAVGESMQFHAHRYDVAGRPAAGGTITWRSDDTTVARVAADGTVTGVAPGKTYIFATDGTRTALVEVLVSPVSGDLVPPTAHVLAISPIRVAANGLDSVTLSVHVTDGDAGTQYTFMSAFSPSGKHFTGCWSFEPETGTRADGTFSCRAAIAPQVEGGAWRVNQVAVVDLAQNSRALRGTGLIWGGVSTVFYVSSPTPDLEAPVFTDVAFTPDSIEANGLDSVTVSLQLRDAGSGVAYANAAFRSPGGNDLAGCESVAPFSGTRAAGTFRCRLAISSGGQPGLWTLESVRTQDATGNVRQVQTAELDSAGYPTVFRVSGPPADTARPALTGFSFSPDSVRANGTDSVTVLVEITDQGSGAERVQTNFVSPSGQTVVCYRYGPVPPRPGVTEIPCRFAIPSSGERGEWRVQFVLIHNVSGKMAGYTTAHLETLGYPVTLTVMPP